jgi:hypothetical protein
MKELGVGRGLRIEGTELGQAALGEMFANPGADEAQRQTARIQPARCLYQRPQVDRSQCAS